MIIGNAQERITQPRSRILHTGLAAVMVLGVVPACVLAQPDGVKGYEALDFGLTPSDKPFAGVALDELGRAKGYAPSERRFEIIPAVWVNGDFVFASLPPEAEKVKGSTQGMSPISGTMTEVVYGDLSDHALVWNLDGQSMLLPLMPGLESCGARALNDSGWVVGGCFTFSFGRPALWIRGGVPIDIGDLGGGTLTAGPADINENGWIVGCSFRPGDPKRICWPVLWKPNGEIIDLIKAIPGRTRAIQAARAINKVGEIISVSPRGYYYYEGILVDIPEAFECNGNSDSLALNDFGLIVGAAPGPGCSEGVAIIWERATPLGDPNPRFNTYLIHKYLREQSTIKLLAAKDINNAGQMVCNGEYENGDEASFLVTPYQFDLSEPTPGRAGERNTITVTGLKPGQRVMLAFGTESGAQPIGHGSGCLGGLVLIRDAQTHPSLEARANQEGVAEFSVFVPDSTKGKTVRYQALAPDECQVSHTVDFRFE